LGRGSKGSPVTAVPHPKCVGMGSNCNSKSRKYNIRYSRIKAKEFSAPLTNLKLQELEASDETESVSNISRPKRGQKPPRKHHRESKEQLPPRTIDADQEDEIIRLLEEQQRELLEQDPMKELEEALMDRTTASQNRR